MRSNAIEYLEQKSAERESKFFLGNRISSSTPLISTEIIKEIEDKIIAINSKLINGVSMQITDNTEEYKKKRDAAIGDYI